MTPAFDATAVVRFRACMGRTLGWNFEDTKLGHLGEVLARRAHSRGVGIDGYLTDLETGVSLEERRMLAHEFSVSETYFFRHQEQFQACAQVAIPSRVAARGSERCLRILSAGCASGEEAYSLAILMHEAGVDSQWKVAIRGVDLNAASLERAVRARYSPWSLREMSAETRRRWFSMIGPELVLDPRIQAAVTFEERNLAAADEDLWLASAYDVVFCRNVLMYFTIESARALVARIAHALAPGGYLFLGHAETLRGLSQEFHLLHTHGTFYYQRHHAAVAAIAAPLVSSTPLSTRTESIPKAFDSSWAATWVETVQRASERIHSLAIQPVVPESLAPPRPRILEDARELLRTERFGEALERLGGASEGRAEDPDLLLLRAVLLMHRGALDEAARACARLLALEELSAGAHYVLALCREGESDPHGAVEENQIAAYLDPTFAMPRLHLGLLARRAGDRDVARRELVQALALLQQEDSSRLLLFGGGFGRDGLIALCRSELEKLGSNL